MNILSIGDIHGKNFWRHIDFSKHDKIIFVGDYVDSANHSATEIVANLDALIRLKKEDPLRVELLLGNHDIQYMYYPLFRCSGYMPEAQRDLSALFHANKQLFQVAFQFKNHLWTHAGVSKSWYTRYRDIISRVAQDPSLTCLAEVLNAIHQSENNFILHEIGPKRGGAKDNKGGITWADKSETEHDFLDGYHQVVGHSIVREITTRAARDASITYIDCLEKASAGFSHFVIDV